MVDVYHLQRHVLGLIASPFFFFPIKWVIVITGIHHPHFTELQHGQDVKTRAIATLIHLSHYKIRSI